MQQIPGVNKADDGCKTVGWW